METYKKFSDIFCIKEDISKKSYSKHFEGAMTQGSGYMHIRGSYEEGLVSAPQNEEYMRMPANVTIEKPRHPRSKFGTYIPGVVGKHPLLNEEIVNLPYPFYIELWDGEERFDMDSSSVESYSRWLDMRDGVMYRSFIWKTKNGNKINCGYKRFVSRKNPNIIYLQGEFIAECDCVLTLRDDIKSDVKTNGYNHFANVRKSSGKCDISTDSGTNVSITSSICGDTDFYEKDGVREGELMLKAQKPMSITKVCCYYTSRDNENYLIKYKNIDEYLNENPFSIDEEYKKSSVEWEKLWDLSHITIKGDDKAQYAVNFSAYHLLRSIDCGDDRVAVCAKGFAGEAYFGHYFWDSEVYLLPFYLYTNPGLAKNLVSFRYKTLDGARDNAKRMGYEGARYPWESSITGEEQCPNWQYADNEIHVTADVIFGMWHYYCNTKENDFLEKAAEVFIETSRYWCSRCYENEDKSIHINGVMGPDEYICFSNDNTYTN